MAESTATTEHHKPTQLPELEDLLRHYVHKSKINSGAPAKALCGAVDTWTKGEGEPGTDLGIVCPECDRIYGFLRK